MKVQAYYQNWQIFWGGTTNSGCRPLTPVSWQPIAKNLNRISYGFALLGEHDYVTKTTSGFAADVPQNYAAHMMYDGTVFTWMAKDGTDDQTVFKEIMDLRKENPDMKALLAFGGWTFTEGTTATYFTTMMNDPDLRGKFMDSAVALAQPADNSYKFDGIEIDWEYPGSKSRSGQPIDFYNMEQFAIEFKKKYPDLLLTFDCGPFLSDDVAHTDALPGYPANDPVPMNGDADYYAWLARLVAAGVTDIQVMAYDFYAAAAGGVTMPNTPLFPPKVDQKNTKHKSQASADPVSISQVTVYGTDNTTVGDLLTTYNNVLNGQPDVDGFSKANGGISVTASSLLDPSKKYNVCGVEYSIQSGDTLYKLCSQGPTAWIDSSKCTPSAAEVQNYNGISDPSKINVGDKVALPIPLTTKYSGDCSSTPPSPPPSSNRSISTTIEGLVKAFEAKSLDPSQSIWCGLALYGHSYQGVKAAAGQDFASFGLPTTGPAPGGFFAGNCGLQNCGSLAYREIDTLLKGPAPTPCTPVPGADSTCGDAYTWAQIPNHTVDNTTATAIAYDADKGLWVTYDDPTTMCMKMCYLSKQKIAGVMLFGPGDDTQNFDLTNVIINYAQNTPVSCAMPDGSTYTCPDSVDSNSDLQEKEEGMC